MNIGQFAREAGVPIDTVRHYERVGLLPAPRRRPSGYRVYEHDDRQRLRFVVRARELGLGLEQIRVLLSLTDPQGEVDADLLERANAVLAELDARVSALSRLREGLHNLLPAHAGLDRQDARVLIESLAPEAP